MASFQEETKKRNKKKNRGCTRKCGRTARKEARRGGPISLFVRGKISAEAYFKLTNQSKD